MPIRICNRLTTYRWVWVRVACNLQWRWVLHKMLDQTLEGIGGSEIDGLGVLLLERSSGGRLGRGSKIGEARGGEGSGGKGRQGEGRNSHVRWDQVSRCILRSDKSRWEWWLTMSDKFGTYEENASKQKQKQNKDHYWRYSTQHSPTILNLPMVSIMWGTVYPGPIQMLRVSEFWPPGPRTEFFETPSGQ